MSYLSLYRKYRPQTFDELIGQEHIVKTLVNQIECDRLGHAYLFTGTRGTGKTSAAKIFARAINCLHPVNGSPCGKCEVCKALLDPSNIDVIEIDAASNNGVNEIRDLREKVQYPPVSCKYKVYIIDEVHMLSISAFNALLKTLEEPPKHAIFILATTEAHKIPATILSRCMRFDFKLISTEKISEVVSKIFAEEGKDFEKEAVFAIAKAGEGSMRDALSIAEIALSYSKNKLTYKDVSEILGSTNFDVLTNFISNIFNGDSGELLNSINSFSLEGKNMGVLLKDVVSCLRDVLIIKTCKNAKTILNIPKSDFETLTNISKNVDSDKVLHIIDVFSSGENNLRYSNHPRAIFESLSLKACKLENDLSIDSLLIRISSLEKKLSEGVELNLNNNEKKIETVTASVNYSVKKKIDSVSNIKEIILYNVRQKIKSEMLYNVIKDVEIETNDSLLTIIVSNKSDLELLNSENIKARIKEALDEYDFNLEVKLSNQKQKLSEIDEASEKVKKIFGEDIVIIKD